MPGQHLELERLQNVALERGKSLRRTSLLGNVTRHPGHRGAPGSTHGSALAVPTEIRQAFDISVGEYPEPDRERNLAAQRGEQQVTRTAQPALGLAYRVCVHRDPERAVYGCAHAIQPWLSAKRARNELGPAPRRPATPPRT